MSYSRQQKEDAIQLLAECYPKAFFFEAAQRRPLKNNIVADLINDGVQLGHDLVRDSVDWYQSNFSYQRALQAGVKRLGLDGKLDGTVTEQEQRNAQKYLEERKREERERKVEEQKRTENLIVEKMPIAKLPTMTANIPKGNPMPKAVKPNDPLMPVQSLLDGVRNVFEQQPEPLQRPLAVAGLRVVIAEIEKTITTLENKEEL